MLRVALRQEFGGLKVFFLKNDIHKWLELSVNQSKVESNFSHHSRWWVLKRHYGLGWHVLKYQAKLFTDQKIAGSELTIHEESGKAVITPFLLVLGCFLYLHQSLPFKILSGIFPLIFPSFLPAFEPGDHCPLLQEFTQLQETDYSLDFSVYCFSSTPWLFLSFSQKRKQVFRMRFACTETI